MIVFIVVPNNSSLKPYVDIALNSIQANSAGKFIESRGEDIPFVVEEFAKNGKRAFGLTGNDLFREYELGNYDSKLTVLKTIPWADKKALFGKPVLCLLGPSDKTFDSLQKSLKVCINSKYKNIAKKYLNTLESRGYSFEKMYLGGSTEAAYSNGLSGLVIDIVYTGASMENAGLKVYDKIFESDLVFIGVKDD